MKNRLKLTKFLSKK